MRQLVIVILAILCSGGIQLFAIDHPNVLFISVDDLNDWIGCLGGHPQSSTPNFDRLADSGVLFTNAYCAGASCNPSRTALMTGIAPHVSGVYSNPQKMRHILPDAEILPKYFSRHGYWSGGSGKILHYFIDAASWDDYYPDAKKENPFPRTLYPKYRPVSLPRGGDWQYIETDWGPLEATDEEFGGDYLVTSWIIEQLQREHAQPFFLACGLYRPHEPWFVPKKYYDRVPPEYAIELPHGVKKGDLDDIPSRGHAIARNRYFKHILDHRQWRYGIRGYLASIAFADEMLGRVLDALDDSAYVDNTIVVLWSDHGWHLGEKEHWQKYTGWRLCARVPLMIRVPSGAPGLESGTTAGTVCSRPVNLLDIFPTLTELTGLPAKPENDGHSLVPLLADPETEWPHVSITHLDRPREYAISKEQLRYIHYVDGGEELYNIEDDPFEWTNLAQEEFFSEELDSFRKLAPTSFAERVLPTTQRPSIEIRNATGQRVKLFWLPEDSDPVELQFLRDGETRTLQSTIGHKFRAETTSGAVLLEFTCERDDQEFVIQLPTQSIAFHEEDHQFLVHEIRDIEGWTVHVDTELLTGEGAEQGKRALRLLDDKLFELTLRLPEKRIKQLRTIHIWIDSKHELTSMQYHPGIGWLKDHGYDPEMVKCVHIPRADRFVAHVADHSQPWALLHELAHGYHDQFLDWDHAAIKQAHQEMVDSGRFTSVLHIDGRMREHYALTNQMEFFAEMSESFLGTNDFYPFVRGELREALPETHALLKSIWLDD